MTLADVMLPVTYEWGRNHALVFSEEMATRLAELHGQHGNPAVVPVPLRLTDGRFMLTADVLTECVPGGMLADMWAAADKAILLPSVDVMPLDEAIRLLPPPEPFPSP